MKRRGIAGRRATGSRRWRRDEAMMGIQLFIVWTKQYETGIPILDEQRRGLVSLINSFFFHRRDANGDIDAVLVPTAEMFKSYARINFATIEALMRDCEYPELERYRMAHEEILAHIAVMDLKYRRHRDAEGLLDFLKEYWLQNLQSGCNSYLPYLQEKYLRI